MKQPADPRSRPVRILGVCGSLQAQSSNRDLLLAAAVVAPPRAEVVISEALGMLPLFNPDLESDPPLSVVAWRRAIVESDALLIACPEYGHSLPGVLKNGIDWTIGSGELVGKVVAVTAATAAPSRGLLGLQALRQTLGGVSARIVGGEPIARGSDRVAALSALIEQTCAALTT